MTVRVYGTNTFDVMAVGWERWGFGPSSGREIHETAHAADYDKDGVTDLELHFRVGSIGARLGSEPVCVSAYEEDVGWRQGCISTNVEG